MHLGHGSTNIKRPRKAFENTKGDHSSRIDFGISSVPSSGVYRRRWNGKRNWFWTILKSGFVLFIIIMMIAAVKDLFLKSL
jgi:hypothetical protein